MASAQNPVLSKLLMADQDGPLDLSVKKNQDKPEPCQQGEGNMHVHARTHISISKEIILKPALKSGRRNPAQTRVQFQEVVLLSYCYIT